MHLIGVVLIALVIAALVKYLFFRRTQVTATVWG